MRKRRLLAASQIEYLARMKFAFLGLDADTLALARYLIDHPEHQLTAVCEPGTWESEIARVAPYAVAPWSWEALLHEPSVDAVVVAVGPEAERAEQLIQLAKAGTPLLVAWPTCDVVAAYELEMIRRDTQASLVPFIPGRLHPAVEQLAALVQAGESSSLGQVEQVVIERYAPERDRPSVLRLFTRDVALVRALVGDLTKISAMGPAPGSAAWGNLSVQMSAENGVLVRWSIQPPDAWCGARMVVVGALGKATLERPAVDVAWALTLPRNAETLLVGEGWSEAAAVIDHFVRSDATTRPSWQEACRDVETAAAVERSLARGRTIELYDDEVSEEATFKGIMAVGGCGLLLLGLLFLVSAAVVEGLDLPFRHHVLWRMWPLYLLAPILVFLLLQLLRLVFYAPASLPPGGNESATSGDR